jgi:hypothetical protein
MRTDLWRINLYLLALLAVAMCGCQTSKRKAEKMTLIELHIEANLDGTEKTQEIAINRTAPVKITVAAEPFLDTRYLTNAVVLDTPGGFFLQLDFDREGAWRLESATSRYTGKRVAILATFPEPRWLAAPLPPRRIGNGRLTFTPDCTREEADRIVSGLHESIKEVKK